MTSVHPENECIEYSCETSETKQLTPKKTAPKKTTPKKKKITVADLESDIYSVSLILAVILIILIVGFIFVGVYSYMTDNVVSSIYNIAREQSSSSLNQNGLMQKILDNIESMRPATDNQLPSIIDF